MTSKVKLKVGAVEIDYEGSEEFLKDGLMQIVQALSILPQARSTATASSQGGDGAQAALGADGEKLSTTTIASQLGAKSCRDLIEAASLKLSLARDEFTTRDIRTEMRSASGFWKKTYTTSVARDLQRMAKAGELHHVSGTTYSMPKTRKDDLLSKLG